MAVNRPEKQRNNLVVGIYFHPEAFPPTLNAIGELSECFHEITIVHRPHMQTLWPFPSNVRAIPSGSYISSIEQELASLPKKIGFFLSFVRSFLSACRKNKPSMILVYDSLSLLAYRMIRPLLYNDHKLWYHNHDVTEWKSLRRYSIGWFAGKTENSAFRYLDIFSLPSNERKKYFPMQEFNGKYFFIPNYPAKKFYNRFYTRKTAGSPLRLIFQGAIGPFHGIEEIISLLREPIENFRLQLVLKGPCRDEHKQAYLDLAAKHGVSDQLIFAGVTPYAEVPATASTCHIGIGILARNDLMNTTLGTASNKLYEYAAVGLPVIYYNSENFVPHLKRYSWAVPAGLDPHEIREAIRSILLQYERFSLEAHSDFESHLNFETGFSHIKAFIKGLPANTGENAN